MCFGIYGTPQEHVSANSDTTTIEYRENAICPDAIDLSHTVL